MTTPPVIAGTHSADVKAEITLKGTEYVILRLTGESGVTWVWLGSVTATSSDGALRVFAKDAKESGTYLAIPERSYRPRVLTVEQQTSVKLG